MRQLAAVWRGLALAWRRARLRGAIGLAVLLGTLAAVPLQTGWAQVDDNPPPADFAAAQTPVYQRAAYPDWNGAVLHTASLLERRRTEGGVIGTLSLQAVQSAWISVLYYAETGKGYSLLDALPLPAGQNLTLTFPLPPGDAGLTRLVCWTAQPGPVAIDAVLRTPFSAEQRITGLTDERWFARSTPALSGPTGDERQQFERPPAGILRSRVPYVWATLELSGEVTAKNCTVQWQGPSRVGNDSLGAFGQWELGMAGNWQVRFVLPSRREISRVVLRLTGQQSTLDGPARPAALQVDLNNWRIGELRPVSPAGVMEPLGLDLSQNIQYGLNTLTLRTAGGGNDWLLQRFELWVE